MTQYQPYMYDSVPCTQSTLTCTYCLVLSHCFYDAYGVHRNVFRMSDEYNSYENDTCARHSALLLRYMCNRTSIKRRILTVWKDYSLIITIAFICKKILRICTILKKIKDHSCSKNANKTLVTKSKTYAWTVHTVGTWNKKVCRHWLKLQCINNPRYNHSQFVSETQPPPSQQTFRCLSAWKWIQVQPQKTLH